MFILPNLNVFSTDPANYTVTQAKNDQNSLLGVVSLLPGAIAVPTYTISGGTVTPNAGVFLIDTSGAALVDLRSISTANYSEGRVIVVGISTWGRYTNYKHAVGGTGQLILAKSVDWATATGDSWISFVLVGGAWREMWRWYGTDTTGYKTYLGQSAIGAATTTAAGIAELATTAEYIAGSDGARTITPQAVAGSYGSSTRGSYQKHPNGWIDQMGTVSLTSNNQPVTVLLPVGITSLVAGPFFDNPKNVTSSAFTAGATSSFKVNLVSDAGFAAAGSRTWWVRTMD